MARTKQLVHEELWVAPCAKCGVRPEYLESDWCEPCIWAFVQEPETQETEIAAATTIICVKAQ